MASRTETPVLRWAGARRIPVRASLPEDLTWVQDQENVLSLAHHPGCYRLYQGALLSIKPFLTPTTQSDIETALADAEKLPRLSDRAFALRKVIDAIRAQAGTPAAGTGKKPGDKTLATLWDRLGG